MLTTIYYKPATSDTVIYVGEFEVNSEECRHSIISLAMQLHHYEIDVLITEEYTFVYSIDICIDAANGSLLVAYSPVAFDEELDYEYSFCESNSGIIKTARDG